MIETSAGYAAAECAVRESYGKLVAYLAKRCGSVDAAEEALAGALTQALERWPVDGVPQVPEAWLLVTARRLFLDGMRRERTAERFREPLLRAALDAQAAFDRSEALADERLGLMFACTHPSIDERMHAPLMLQAVLGFDAASIASAFLVAPSAMGQRLVRAKGKIAAAGVPFELPPVDVWPQRLDGVLAALYGAFSQSWDDPGGREPRSRGFSLEAIRLCRVLLELCPREPEIAGLLALMLFAHARRRARRTPDGAYVPLESQDVTLWDAPAIEEAERLLRRALSFGRIGRLQLEAAIGSAHMARRIAGTTDWNAILDLYDGLTIVAASPVVTLNRAVAVGRVADAAEALAALKCIESDARMQTYQPYWAVRADLLARANRGDEAAEAYRRAIGLTTDPSVRKYLADRMGALR